MHPTTLVPLLTEERHRQTCPCGAVSEHPYGLCRKCHGRMTWRRRTTDNARRAARRQRRGRSARERARVLAFAASIVRANRAGS
jgi:hypothetical protein